MVVVKCPQSAETHGEVSVDSSNSVPAGFIHLEDEVRVFPAGCVTPRAPEYVSKTLAVEVIDAVGLGAKEDVSGPGQAEVLDYLAFLPA